ncbi:DUF6941 family protein [Burkholderia arboris]|uniref:DUF6941 family protein n=1 Tax=Burkholderia arboris TaxID=488730 RepID=UPI001CF2FFA5|nr:hypothetical protein [Burkholderia arboris]MCA8492537.1 hypothetical protein [Burkholderia arboris]
MTKLNAPYLHVVYCDDVRSEIGGKFTLVGVYSSDLQVPTAPVALPKLCVVSTFVVPINMDVTQLNFKLMKDDVEIAKFEIDTPRKKPAINPLYTRWTYSNITTLSPFPIEGPGTLRVIAESNLGTFIGSGIRILVGNSEDSRHTADDQ